MAEIGSPLVGLFLSVQAADSRAAENTKQPALCLDSPECLEQLTVRTISLTPWWAGKEHGGISM